MSQPTRLPSCFYSLSTAAVRVKEEASYNNPVRRFGYYLETRLIQTSPYFPEGQGLNVGLRRIRVECISSSFLIVAFVLITISPRMRGIRITIALNPGQLLSNKTSMGG